MISSDRQREIDRLRHQVDECLLLADETLYELGVAIRRERSSRRSHRDAMSTRVEVARDLVEKVKRIIRRQRRERERGAVQREAYLRVKRLREGPLAYSSRRERDAR